MHSDLVCTFVVLLLAYAKLSYASPGALSSLTSQLYEILTDNRLPRSTERSSLLAALRTYSIDIDHTLSTGFISKNNGNNSSYSAAGVCQICKVLFRNSEILDGATPGYLKATEVNW